jgi:hypothetical protein
MATGWDACMEEGHRRWLAWSGTGQDGYGLPEGCRWVLNPLWGYPHLDTKRCHTSLGSLSLDPTAFPLSAPAGKRTHVEKVIGCVLLSPNCIYISLILPHYPPFCPPLFTYIPHISTHSLAFLYPSALSPLASNISWLT